MHISPSFTSFTDGFKQFVSRQKAKLSQSISRPNVHQTDQVERDYLSNAIAAEHSKLFELIKQEYERTGKRPIRVVSQQLNSYENKKESKMIDSQHECIAYLNEKMQSLGMGEIIHLNTPSNRNFHTTKALGLAGNLLPGERRSKQQNIDSLFSYCKWLYKDDSTGSFTGMPSQSETRNKEVQNCQKNIQTTFFIFSL